MGCRCKEQRKYCNTTILMGQPVHVSEEEDHTEFDNLGDMDDDDNIIGD